jgi:hypothetical protein
MAARPVSGAIQVERVVPGIAKSLLRSRVQIGTSRVGKWSVPRPSPDSVLPPLATPMCPVSVAWLYRFEPAHISPPLTSTYTYGVGVQSGVGGGDLHGYSTGTAGVLLGPELWLPAA